MLSAASISSAGNQSFRIGAGEELESAIIDLVGDLAAYRPGGKIVIFEGGGDTEFDVKMTSALFPQFAAQVTMISGGSKQRVRKLHEVLANIRVAGKIPEQFYSITDRDCDDEEVIVLERAFSWDAYHIENYLLEPRVIELVLRDLSLGISEKLAREGIESILRECARETVEALVSQRVQDFTYRELRECIQTKIGLECRNPILALRQAIEGSYHRLETKRRELLSDDRLKETEDKIRTELSLDLNADTWKKRFVGRSVLNRFVGQHVPGITYLNFRNLILSRMVEEKIQPEGMKTVLYSIIDDPR